ncbi:MAG: sulfite exporter TauE/SafE family protein [Pseudomonadota bacterium]
MPGDPLFWSVAILAVLITGVAKGGFGGLGLLAVPLMALIMSPVQAAGVMLPILLVMDVVSVAAYRKHWDKTVLLLTLPGAVVGILIGALLAGYVNDNGVRIFVGLIAVCFPVYTVLKPKSDASVVKDSKPLGAIAGLTAGFTSFVAHAGGPPYQAYALPQNLEKRVFAGTSVAFFFIVNIVKIVPYALLGQFDRTNLMTSALLIPLAPIGVMLGVWLVNRINPQWFFRIIYALIFVVGLKLLWSGVGALLMT